MVDFKLENDKCEILTKYNFQEQIDARLLSRLIGSGLLRGDYKAAGKFYGCAEKTHLIKLKKKLKDGVLKVRYNKPKLGFGRVVAKGLLSLGALRKIVRHTLCNGKWIDADVANCAPKTLCQIAQSHGEPCPALSAYCCQREECLVEITKLFLDGHTEETRDFAKNLFISILNGGSHKTWQNKHKDILVDSAKLPKLVVDLQTEATNLSRWLQTGNPELVKALEKKKDGRCLNFDGKFIAHYLQHQERRVLECTRTLR